MSTLWPVLLARLAGPSCWPVLLARLLTRLLVRILVRILASPGKDGQTDDQRARIAITKSTAITAEATTL
jgi:hypothetical protein